MAAASMAASMAALMAASMAASAAALAALLPLGGAAMLTLEELAVTVQRMRRRTLRWRQQ